MYLLIEFQNNRNEKKMPTLKRNKSAIKLGDINFTVNNYRTFLQKKILEGRIF